MQQPFDRELFRKRLNSRRKQLGLTYRKFEAQSGLSMTTIHGYIVGRTLPNLEYAYQLAQVLGVTVDWLCGMDKPQK